MPRPTEEAIRRTAAFARVTGPFLATVALIVAIRLPDLDGVVRRAVVGEVHRGARAAEVRLRHQRVDRLADQIGATIRHHHNGDGRFAASDRLVEAHRC